MRGSRSSCGNRVRISPLRRTAPGVDGIVAPGRRRSHCFYPDGTADAREIQLEDRDGFRLVLRINPTTARVQNHRTGTQVITSQRNAGFSLVEVMCAILILGIAMVGLTQGITTALSSNKESELQTTAALLAAGQMELLQADKILTDGEEQGECGRGPFALPLETIHQQHRHQRTPRGGGDRGKLKNRERRFTSCAPCCSIRPASWPRPGTAPGKAR